MGSPYIKMSCELEGECHGLTLLFFNEKQRMSLLTQIKVISKKYTLTPRVTICKLGNHGEIHIDFFKECYYEGTHFLEDFIQSLNIESCTPSW